MHDGLCYGQLFMTIIVRGCEDIAASIFANIVLLVIEGIINIFFPIRRLGVETLPNSNSEATATERTDCGPFIALEMKNS